MQAVKRRDSFLSYSLMCSKPLELQKALGRCSQIHVRVQVRLGKPLQGQCQMPCGCGRLCCALQAVWHAFAPHCLMPVALLLLLGQNLLRCCQNPCGQEPVASHGPWGDEGSFMYYLTNTNGVQCIAEAL